MPIFENSKALQTSNILWGPLACSQLTFLSESLLVFGSSGLWLGMQLYGVRKEAMLTAEGNVFRVFEYLCNLSLRPSDWRQVPRLTG